MKVKTKNLKTNSMLVNREQRIEARGQTSVFCLLSSVFLFFSGIAITSEQSGSTDSYLLWQSRISVPESQEDKKYKDELRRLIEQIRSIQFEPKSPKSEPVIPKHFVIEPVLIRSQQEPKKSDPSLVTRDPNDERRATSDERRFPEPDIELPYQPISNQTLQMLEDVSQHPDQIHNPTELAEILFLSGNLKQAAMLYQQALNRKAQDKAWILFQIGNCLRGTPPGGNPADDLPTARKVYRQMITEYPNSLWAEIAMSQEKLIDWYLTDKPQTLIAEWSNAGE